LLKKLIVCAEKLLKNKYQKGILLGTDGSHLGLKEDQPIFEHNIAGADVNGYLVYYPKNFNRDNNEGKTKKEILAEQEEARDEFCGYNISLREDLPDLPAKGNGKVIGGRKQPEAGKLADEYLALLKEEQYVGERGFTYEDELIYLIRQLQKNNQVIDDWQGRGKANWLLGSLLHRRLVAVGRWNRNNQQFFMLSEFPSNNSGINSVRFLAEI